MVAHAREEAPNECCGLLAGVEQISALFRIANLPSDAPLVADLQVPPDRRFRYVMDPAQQLRAFKKMREDDLTLLAIYHSHPHSPAYPSATDVRLAVYPDVHALIVSLEHDPDVRAFRIVGQAITEVHLSVDGSGPNEINCMRSTHLVS
jgi:proteasome lid subunit RPN8/RPN11